MKDMDSMSVIDLCGQLYTGKKIDSDVRITGYNGSDSLQGRPCVTDCPKECGEGCDQCPTDC